jgi:hypothetical protein
MPANLVQQLRLLLLLLLASLISHSLILKSTPKKSFTCSSSTHASISADCSQLVRSR